MTTIRRVVLVELRGKRWAELNKKKLFLILEPRPRTWLFQAWPADPGPQARRSTFIFHPTLKVPPLITVFSQRISSTSDLQLAASGTAQRTDIAYLKAPRRFGHPSVSVIVIGSRSDVTTRHE